MNQSRPSSCWIVRFHCWVVPDTQCCGTVSWIKLFTLPEKAAPHWSGEVDAAPFPSVQLAGNPCRIAAVGTYFWVGWAPSGGMPLGNAGLEANRLAKVPAPGSKPTRNG